MARNFLPLSAQMQVAEELRPLREDIEAGKHTSDALAQFIGQKLNIKITGHNIDGILDALNINKKKVSNDLSVRVKTLEEQNLDARVRFLESLLEKSTSGTN
jgi:hypothetical protein